MSDSVAGIIQQPESPQLSRSRIVWYVFVRLAQRLTFTLILVLGVIYFAALAINLAQRGGLKALPKAAPAAVDATAEVLGDAFGGRLEAIDELQRVLLRSLGLLFASLALGSFLGILLGGLAALYRNSRLSIVIINGSILGISTPSYVAAMFLIWTVVAIYRQTGVRILPVFGFGWDLRMVMPMIVLATRPMANITRLTYTSLKDVFEADFVRTARSKGLLPRIVFIRHVLRNAGVPILTTASVSFRFSLSMLPIVETIFSWLGIGYALIQAMQSMDFQRVVVMITPLVLLFALMTILLDFLYPLIDPRLVNPKGVE